MFSCLDKVRLESNHDPMILSHWREKLLKQTSPAPNVTLIDIPKLASQHIQNCRLLVSREELLKTLPKNSICAEIGIFEGYFSEEILKCVQPKKLHLIEIHEPFMNEVMERLEPLAQPGQITPHIGNSYDLLEEFEDNYFDWIYIDGNHSYEYVKKELLVAKRKVKTDGLILLNDYLLYDHINKYRMGVVDATNEFCLEYDYELIYLAFHPQMYCDVVLRKRGVGI